MIRDQLWQMTSDVFKAHHQNKYRTLRAMKNIAEVDKQIKHLNQSIELLYLRNQQPINLYRDQAIKARELLMVLRQEIWQQNQQQRINAGDGVLKGQQQGRREDKVEASHQRYIIQQKIIYSWITIPFFLIVQFIYFMWTKPNRQLISKEIVDQFHNLIMTANFIITLGVVFCLKVTERSSLFYEDSQQQLLKNKEQMKQLDQMIWLKRVVLRGFRRLFRILRLQVEGLVIVFLTTILVSMVLVGLFIFAVPSMKITIVLELFQFGSFMFMFTFVLWLTFLILPLAGDIKENDRIMKKFGRWIMRKFKRKNNNEKQKVE